MRRLHKCKAFVSYDALLSIMPIMFLLAFVFQIMVLIHDDATATLRQKELFNFLVVTADYAVKKGAAVADGQNNLQPNLIDPAKINAIETMVNANSRHRIAISLGDDSPGQMEMCIYRLVVEKNSLETKKLYVCGDYANP